LIILFYNNQYKPFIIRNFMVTRLYISGVGPEDSARVSPLEVSINRESGRLQISNGGSVVFEFENYSRIDKEYRDGCYPAIKVVYKLGGNEDRARDARKIMGISYIKIRKEEDGGVEEPFAGRFVPFLDLIFLDKDVEITVEDLEDSQTTN